MTDLAARKTKLKTTTNARVGKRPLVVELHPDRPHALYIREHGRRSGFWVPFLAVYQTGAKIADLERRAAKRGRR